ncbi:choline-sulfatase [Saccharata proteae CBS 121410]|uniref:Choline-sulfatase n=1 Tax=Saccharata proteae CBS 121410 TaxID=1314787 RepID=A0A9P4HX11_9PEZI|nr:choline-sulfatase [Saccharata proteae CBS 121410]
MAPHAEIPPTPPNGMEAGYLPPADFFPARPNILYIMADQMSAPLLQFHDPDSPIKTPHLNNLAETGVVFDRAYCNAPLCAPSRFVMVTGQLPHKVKAYDNASHLNADVPTFAHYLRKEGYETTLAGKMHFIGPDQLHGFENRLTSDIYPGDFGWSVNWDKPEERQEWFHNMSSVLQAGPCVRSNQLDYDEEVMYKSTQYLYDHVRKGDKQKPFCLTVSLTHPHDPYAITEEYWDQYEDVEIPMPKVHINQEDQDPHSKRIMKCIDLWDNEVPDEAVKRARRAYYGACTYVDDQVGKLMKVLKQCKLDKNTVVVFSGDHGDMLGERDMWYKMSWYENSARVPLIINYPPRFSPRRVQESVSTMDLLPTLVDIAGGRMDTGLTIDGESFYPTLFGHRGKDTVFGEYMGEGSESPVMMIRRGPYKYTCCLLDPPQLYDLEKDPQELHNVAQSDDAVYKKVAAAFAEEAAQKWDLKAIHEDALRSQRQRRLCWNALKKGTFTSWDYQPDDKASQKYIRSTIPLDDLELRARYPPVDALGKTFMTQHPHGMAAAKGQ